MRHTCHTLIAALFLVATASLASAQATRPGAEPMGLELDGVPNELALPAPTKENRLLTVRVHNGPARDVWLARSREAQAKVRLSYAGEGRYQLNLADEEVVRVLRQTGGSGQCHVFAVSPSGQVVASPAIRFAISTPSRAQLLASRKGDEQGLRSVAHVGHALWLEPAQTTALAFEVEPDADWVKAAAHAGGKSWPLQRRKPGLYALDITPEIAAEWRKAGQIQLALDPQVHQPSAIVARALPDLGTLPEGGLKLQLTADAFKEVPGTKGYLNFYLQSVHESYVQLAFRQAGEPAPAGHVYRDQPHAFRIGGEQFVWAVTQIVPSSNGVKGSVVVTILKGKAAEAAVARYAIMQLCHLDQSARVYLQGEPHKPQDAVAALLPLYGKAAEDGAPGGLPDFIAALRKREDAPTPGLAGEARDHYINGGHYRRVPVSLFITGALESAEWQLDAPPEARRVEQ